MFLRGPLLFLVCVVAEMLGIKELANKNLSCSKNPSYLTELSILSKEFEIGT